MSFFPGIKVTSFLNSKPEDFLTESNQAGLLLAQPILQMETQLISGPNFLGIIGSLLIQATENKDFSLIDPGARETEDFHRLRNPVSYRASLSQVSHEAQKAFR